MSLEMPRLIQHTSLPDEHISDWLEQLPRDYAQLVLPIFGVTAERRLETYKRIDTNFSLVGLSRKGWKDEALDAYIVSSFGRKIEALLYYLVTTRDLDISSELESYMQSQGFLRSAFSSLWEARFTKESNTNFDVLRWVNQEYMPSLAYWNEEERLEILLFWFTLGQQSGAYDSVIMTFEDFHETPRLLEFLRFVDLLQTWRLYGSTVGILLGVPDLDYPMPSALRELLVTTPRGLLGRLGNARASSEALS